MSLLRKMTVLLSGLALSLTMAACEKEGPAERAGEKIDNTVEKVQKKAGEAADSARETMKDTAENVQKKTDDAMKAVGEKMEETGEKMQKSADK